MHKTNKTDMIVFHIVPLVFYLFFAFFDGPVICADSPSYINMYLSREPIYPMLLALLRGISETYYLYATVIIQSVLAAFAATYIAIQFTKLFRLRWYESYAVMVLPLLVSAFCRFIAKRASMYSNSILTEGITCSLYLIFFVLIVKYSIADKISDLIWMLLVLIIMISTRKQMYVCLILAAILFVCRIIKSKGVRIRNVVLLIALVGITILANKGIERGYHMMVNGQPVEHFNSNRFLATMVFYVAEESDSQYIEDEEVQNLFITIYEQCDAEQSMMHSAPSGIFARLNHFGDHYDMIQIDHMWPAIENYVLETKGIDGVEREIEVDNITRQIIVGILPHRIVDLVSVILISCIDGLINTVAKVNPILSIYALAFWVLYLLILLVRSKKTKFDDISKMGLLALTATVINIGVVATQIFCQTRYMIYNMPIIYIAIILMMRKKDDAIH